MKIRWSYVVLGLLGVVAALAAAALTASLSVQDIQAAIPEQAEEEEVTIIVAARDLPAMSKLTKEDIEVKAVPVSSAPKQYFSDEAQVIGSVLTLEALEGETLSNKHLSSQGHGFELASQLPQGKRAVTVALHEYSGLEGLLYPGCTVDVVAYFKFEGQLRERLGAAVSTTLLQNVKVLGVENSTVVRQADQEEVAQRRTTPRGYNDLLMVTLMVDARQAEALQLAMEHGTISLAMRNPKDADIARSDATLLNGVRLASLSQLLEPKVDSGEDAQDQPLAFLRDATSEPMSGEQVAEGEAPAPRQEKTASQSRNEAWQMDIIRGLLTERRQFPAER